MPLHELKMPSLRSHYTPAGLSRFNLRVHHKKSLISGLPPGGLLYYAFSDMMIELHCFKLHLPAFSSHMGSLYNFQQKTISIRFGETLGQFT